MLFPKWKRILCIDQNEQIKKGMKTMTTHKYQKVYSANGILQAIVLQSMLEKAGIPAAIVHSKNGSYLDVLVSEKLAEEARNLLNAQSAEIAASSTRRTL
jgi:hypothetical protein